MISLILALSMMKPSTGTTAQIQPCVWPNTCRSVAVVQIQPCVWPNTCVATPRAG
jgi:hypothetical protein